MRATIRPSRRLKLIFESDKRSSHLTEGLETGPEGVRQLNEQPWLYALLAFVAVVMVAVALLLWLA